MKTPEQCGEARFERRWDIRSCLLSAGLSIRACPAHRRQPASRSRYRQGADSQSEGVGRAQECGRA